MCTNQQQWMAGLGNTVSRGLQLERHLLICLSWRGARAVEGARLESVCAARSYRGFESLSLRQFISPELFGREFSNYKATL